MNFYARSHRLKRSDGDIRVYCLRVASMIWQHHRQTYALLMSVGCITPWQQPSGCQRPFKMRRRRNLMMVKSATDHQILRRNRIHLPWPTHLRGRRRILGLTAALPYHMASRTERAFFVLLVYTIIASAVGCHWICDTTSCTDAARTRNKASPNTSSAINESPVQMHEEDGVKQEDVDSWDEGEYGMEEGIMIIVGGI